MGQPLKATNPAQPSDQPPPNPSAENTTAGSSDPKPTGAGANTGAGTTRPKTAEELEADRLYEERMEDEYAKREGGA